MTIPATLETQALATPPAGGLGGFDAEELAAPRTPFQQVWQHLPRDRLAIAGLIVLATLVALAVLGKLLTEWWVVFDPADRALAGQAAAAVQFRLAERSHAELRPEFGVYLFGTDELGRSVLARMLQGAFVSLSIGLVAVGISVTLGVVLGGIAGYYGERQLGFVSIDTLDHALHRRGAVLSHFLSDPDGGRAAPAQHLQHHDRDRGDELDGHRALRARRVSGAARARLRAGRAGARLALVADHLSPHGAERDGAGASSRPRIDVAHAMLTESALSFLGFGVQPPHATWGNILADGRTLHVRRALVVPDPGRGNLDRSCSRSIWSVKGCARR